MSGQLEQLQALYEGLSAPDRETLLAFARFLASGEPRTGAVSSSEPAPVEPVPEPLELPRPQDERVVAAVKRLSKTYFMLSKSRMLGVTGDLVTQHVLQGREAADVIDELELEFRRQYERLLEASGQEQ